MKEHKAVSGKVLIYIFLFIALINFIGWLTKPDNYKPQYPRPQAPNSMQEEPKEG